MSELVTKAGALWMLQNALISVPYTVALFTAPTTGMSGLDDQYGSFTEVEGGGYQRCWFGQAMVGGEITGHVEGAVVSSVADYEVAGIKTQYTISAGDVPTVRLTTPTLIWTFTGIPEVPTIRGYAVMGSKYNTLASGHGIQSLVSNSTELNTPGNILFAEFFDQPFIVENPEDELRIPYMIFQLKDW